MEGENTFGTLRLHKKTIERLKDVKRSAEYAERLDFTWDDFIEMLLNKAFANKK